VIVDRFPQEEVIAFNAEILFLSLITNLAKEEN